MDMLKLRTMYVGTDAVDRRITDPNDNRFTPVGKILRVLKIDELPQFWNVIKGDMSIVGPRPEDWEIVQEYYTAEYMLTLNVRPGITSLAAISWYPDFTYHDPPPAGVPIQDWYLKRHLPLQISEAFRYMEKQSMLFDLKMICQTFYCVIKYSWLPPQKRSLSIIAN
jgi:lipopolysaccharide/colanic/teichoic acid biosynthesis glycosyltransferase